ncbi:hypothetical protein LCGC14_3036540, partial [marine sediment metagenome]
GGSVAQQSGALSDIFNRAPRGEDFETFFREGIADPLLQLFNEEIIPGIGRRFSGGNFFGSERLGAEGEARGDLLSELTRSRSQLAFEDRRAGTEEIFGALDRTASPVAGILASLAAGDTSRLVELQRLARTDQRVAQLLEAIGLSTKDTVATAGQGGILGDLLGGAGAVLGGASAASEAGLFASSKEFKTDKRELGSVLDKFDGVPVERWRYKDVFNDPREHIGPYAEDFAEAFGVGDGVTISVMDSLGVMMAGVKELKARVEELEAS